MSEALIALDLGDESYTFPLPFWRDTIICRWGPGPGEGEYIYRDWTDEQISAWHWRAAKWALAERQWGWLRKIPRPGSRIVGEDDEGEPIYRTPRLTQWLYRIENRLLAPHPGPRMSARIEGNRCAGMDISGDPEGVAIISNIFDGGGGFRMFA